MYLFTVKDVKATRERLLKEQHGTCAVTRLNLESKDSVLDHDHDTSLVRAVLHRQVNAFLGKLENNYKRLIKWWCDIPLADLLRLYADYLEDKEKNPGTVYHPGWIKKSKTEFNKLNEKQKSALLKSMNLEDASNSAERKKIFAKALTSKKFNFDEIKIKIKEIS